MLPHQDNSDNSELKSVRDSIQQANIALFNQLFAADKKRLYAYIFAFVSNKTIADDIFQETCLTLWQKFDTFEPGSNFSKWANTIAYYKILKFRKKNSQYLLGLDDDFMQEFSENIRVIESKSLEREQKWLHLDKCRTALSSTMQLVYQGFYVENLTAQAMADSTGRSIYAIRKAVGKLRKKLIDCVDSKTSER
ncbi:sigma-70 family RNA polymerase sigma factor [Catenovulum agarivorans]|uniref:sigma-70 family RNA polymerase sigma factor n=1 Tax=Catenovulum agarivorans TaxID=1172192 RepID=UPI0002E80053|nr:sigma-70 family RNA polymerase sigma factor [Catenovulum agarivorans]